MPIDLKAPLNLVSLGRTLHNVFIIEEEASEAQSLYEDFPPTLHVDAAAGHANVVA